MKNIQFFRSAFKKGENMKKTTVAKSETLRCRARIDTALAKLLADVRAEGISSRLRSMAEFERWRETFVEGRFNPTR
jgi:hypothetical protein